MKLFLKSQLYMMFNASLFSEKNSVTDSLS